MLASLSKQVSSVLNHQSHKISNITRSIQLNNKRTKKGSNNTNNNSNSMWCKIPWAKYPSGQRIQLLIAYLCNNSSSSKSSSNYINNLRIACLVISSSLPLLSLSKSLDLAATTKQWGHKELQQETILLINNSSSSSSMQLQNNNSSSSSSNGMVPVVHLNLIH